MATETKSNPHMEYIEMCDSEGIPKASIMENLRDRGISKQQIDEAYHAYCIKQNLYAITFNERPLGLTILIDHIRNRLIIAGKIENETNSKLKIGSRLYEIQGQRVDNMEVTQVKTLIEDKYCPFYVIFQEAKISETKLSAICQLICHGYIRRFKCDSINIFNITMKYYIYEYKNINSIKSNEKRIFTVDNIFDIQVKDIAYNNEKKFFLEPPTNDTNDTKVINNEIWKDKSINEWNTDELSSWLLSLGLDNKYINKLVAQIREEGICGEDINACESGTDIAESFEDINDEIGNKIFKQLENIRITYGNDENKNENDIDIYINYDNNPYILRDSSRGVIGLRNLGNTCFINCVIQCLLQTPSLIQVLRKWQSNSYSSSMLDSFIEIARAATQNNSKNSYVNPSSIVKCLRNSDVRFERGAQGDALSAVSKMIELLDVDIINRLKLKVTPMGQVINHPGSWHNEDILNEDDEEELIIGNRINYNPYQSVIRDKMHFIERNILYCMNPGCNYKESRYEFREKVLLPLHDHSINICIDIYIPSINKIIKKEIFNVLDYCSVNTLMHAIYKRISNECELLKSMEQIKIKMMKVNRNNDLKDWIKDIYAQNECKCFINDNIYIFAVIKEEEKSNKFIVSTFNIFIDENENINSNKSYLEFDEMKDGEIKIIEKINVDGYNKNIYFKQEIVNMNSNDENDNKNYECKMDENDNIIICLWSDENVEINLEYMDIERKVYDGFVNKYNNRINQKISGKVQNDIGNAFDVYLSDKLLDRGAVLKCNKCNRKSDVFMVKTKIVEYPEILIFTIDRYIDGDKFREIVNYPHELEYDNGYELYGICNHSGTLSGGHYWAYVKGIDDNNWYNANDSSITGMDPFSVINKASAIILMYKKIQ